MESYIRLAVSICIYLIDKLKYFIVYNHTKFTVKLNEQMNKFNCTLFILSRNGGTETSPIIGKYCGTEVPSNIRSLANTLYLKFESDATNTFAGFRILWDGTSTGRTICLKVLS